MSELHVVLHPRFPPAVDTALRSMPGVVLHCPADDAGVVRALDAGAQVLATFTWRPEFLRPSLRWIAGTGAGTEQYPLAQFRERGIVLTTAAGVHAECVAEHAFALMLALTRRIGEAVRHMTARRWQALPGEQLAGKKLAIVGLGRIGEQVARRAQPWGLEIMGVKRDPKRYDGCVRDVRGEDQLDAACEWADILLLAAPARPDRSSLLGAGQLERLGRGWLVNVGRGSLVDEPALVRALESGRLRGAGLDVTAVEPLPPESPLWGMPNVVITAHNAGDSPGFGPRWGAIFARNRAAFTGDGEWENLATGRAAA
ncbi:D-2-hydroxyacid dehydrogenase [Ramlibacter sp. RBP-2]|uniref:D-2-hydroxyacid dehydrogenase n=1 Tax=Ramlibacter lithotrophicus TaxID=2606681 RepID=A0A7X6DFS9_9BURK|nr:D-2-hydroxyacid dehydrogenase [Ramlibacter lithotrophicus]NKE66337.1 D-2-hydroxyacid dehydrogenase [Ramlibacter lithotrophicus]